MSFHEALTLHCAIFCCEGPVLSGLFVVPTQAYCTECSILLQVVQSLLQAFETYLS